MMAVEMMIDKMMTVEMMIDKMKTVEMMIDKMKTEKPLHVKTSSYWGLLLKLKEPSTTAST